MNKLQADKHMIKQLTRIGGKYFNKYGSHGQKCQLKEICEVYI